MSDPSPRKARQIVKDWLAKGATIYDFESGVTCREFSEVPHYPGLNITVDAPGTKVWASNGAHVVSVCWFTERPEAWVEVAVQLDYGLAECEQAKYNGRCDVCDEADKE